MQNESDDKTQYRYRWVYSEGYGDWFNISLPRKWTEEQVREQMDYIEISDGPKHGCRWSNFQFENVT